MRFLLPLLILLCGLGQARAALTFDVTTNVPASELEFTNAFYTLGSTGQKVLILIGPGSFTLNTTITHSRNLGLSLRGSGMANTTVYGPASSPYAIVIQHNPTGNFPFVITDLNLVGNSSQTGGFISVGANVGTKFNSWYEIARIRMTNCIARGFSLGYGDAFGYVHDMQFEFPSGAGNFNAFQFGGNGFRSWTNANPIGTTNFVYVLDSTFTNRGTQIGNGFFDCYNGSQVHIQRDKFDGNAATGAHGYDSQPTSARVGVVMSNIWTSLTSAALPLELRGGSWQMQGNTFSGTLALDACESLSYYRDSWGSYQSGLSYPGYALTNWFQGKAVSATASSITCSNFPSGTNIGSYAVQLAGDSSGKGDFNGFGRAITITGGTGSGQVRIISSASMGSQTSPSLLTLNVSTNWTTNPDSTSTFELGFVDGSQFNVGNLPAYSFVATTNQFATIARQVLLGTNLNQTLDNLLRCVNLDPTGSGVVFSAYTVTASTGPNADFRGLTHTTNSITWTNQMDGPNGYPGAMAPGVISQFAGTNSGQAVFPCVTVNDTLNGSNINFGLKWQASSTLGPVFIDDVQNGRDYYASNSLPITPVLPQTMLSDPALTISASIAGVLVTNTSDLFGVTSVVTPGAVNYIVGESVTLTAPSTVLGHSFLKWQRDASDYSTNALISFTVDQARTFTAVYDTSTLARSQRTGRTSSTGRTLTR